VFCSTSSGLEVAAPFGSWIGDGDLTLSVDHVIPGQSPLHRKRTPRTTQFGGLFESMQSLLGEDSLMIGMLDKSLHILHHRNLSPNISTMEGMECILVWVFDTGVYIYIFL